MASEAKEHDVALTTDELTLLIETLQNALGGLAGTPREAVARELIIKLERAHALGLSG